MEHIVDTSNACWNVFFDAQLRPSNPKWGGGGQTP